MAWNELIICVYGYIMRRTFNRNLQTSFDNILLYKSKLHFTVLVYRSLSTHSDLPRVSRAHREQSIILSTFPQSSPVFAPICTLICAGYISNPIQFVYAYFLINIYIFVQFVDIFFANVFLNTCILQNGMGVIYDQRTISVVNH